MLFAAEIIIAAAPHKFGFEGKEFMLDGEKFQIRSGEMHPSRIPY